MLAAAAPPDWPLSRVDAPRRSRFAASADHVRFVERSILRDAFEEQIRYIERVEAAVQNELGDGAADDGGLLHAVARESIHEQQVFHRCMCSQNGVVIEGVHLEVARPGAFEFSLLEGGN